MSDCNLLQAQLLAEQVQSSGGAFDRAATLRYEAALMSAVHVHSAGTCMFIAWLLTPPLAQACPSFRTPSVEQGAAPQANGRAALGIRCQLQSEGRECLVRGIIRSGPAASAGIRNGDVILPLDDADSTWQGWTGGCDYYMNKPFDTEDLLSVVDNLVAGVAA